MTARVPAWWLLWGFWLATAAFAPALPGLSSELDEAALTLSPEAPGRLVLAYWPRGGWQVRQSGRQVEITLPGAGLVISADAIALPVDGGAITSLTTEIIEGSATLNIGLGCDCKLAVQGDGERLLIDVVGTGRVAGPIYSDSVSAPRLAPVPAARRTGVGDATDALTLTDSQQVEETRNRLLTELRRAAEAGLVTLRPGAGGLLAQAGPSPETPVAEIAIDGPHSELADVTSGVPAVELTGQTAAGLAAETGSDSVGDIGPGVSVSRAAKPEVPVIISEIALGVLDSPRPLPVSAPLFEHALSSPGEPSDWWRDSVAASPAPACFGNEAFRLTDPLPAPVLIAEISRLRRALIGEFDRIDIAAALSLSRLYLAHGLGVEAAATLAEFAPDAPETGLLSALAWLAEGRALPEPNILSVSGCTGQHALWQGLNAALAARPAQAVELEAAAIGALEQTARGLRGRIAVRLGLAATAEGDWIAAYRLNAMARRAIPDDDRSGQDLRLLLEARLELGRGNTPVALARLKALRGSRSPAGAKALLILAELAIDPALDADVSPEKLRLDLGVLATMQRDTPLGARAFLSEARLTGYLFGREAAFELLAYGLAGRVIGEIAYRDALIAVEASLSARPGDEDTPLALFFEAGPERFTGALENPGFRMALARSYLDLGAPSLAESVLTATDLQSEALLAKLSRTYLYIGDVEAADRLAARLPEGPDRAAVEAGVALASGNAADALIALTEAGASAPRRARAAWTAGEWSASATALAEVMSAPEAGAVPAREGVAGQTMPEGLAKPLSQAARLIVVARRAGRATLPPEAATFAEAMAKPGLAAGLQAIFEPLPERLADPSPAAVANYLETFSAEARLIEEILEDG